jgi:hypothetical protein
VLSAIVAWWGWVSRKQDARRQAYRHMAVIAHAVYTGSTSAYTLVPDLPRSSNSSEVRW